MISNETAVFGATVDDEEEQEPLQLQGLLSLSPPTSLSRSAVTSHEDDTCDFDATMMEEEEEEEEEEEDEGEETSTSSR